MQTNNCGGLGWKDLLDKKKQRFNPLLFLLYIVSSQNHIAFLRTLDFQFFQLIQLSFVCNSFYSTPTHIIYTTIITNKCSFVKCNFKNLQMHTKFYIFYKKYLLSCISVVKYSCIN